jgi:hypothetical protein
MPYPTYLDLKAFLNARGLSCSDLTDDDYRGMAASAAAEWEARTGWLPFLAGASETRTIDGPEGRLIIPPFGIVSLTVLAIDGTSYTVDQDYFLQYKILNGPYQAIEMDGYLTGARRSIALTGVFGYTATLPADVKLAILGKAAEGLYYHITGLQGEVVREKQGPVEFEYAKPTSGQASLSGVVGSFKGIFEQAVARYKRVTL